MFLYVQIKKAKMDQQADLMKRMITLCKDNLPQIMVITQITMQKKICSICRSAGAFSKVYLQNKTSASRSRFYLPLLP